MPKANSYGFTMPANTHPGYDTTRDRGVIMINLTGVRIPVEGISGGEAGGIGNKESFVVIGDTSPSQWGGSSTHYTIVFTGPDGAPRYGVITAAQFNTCTFWGDRRFEGGYCKTYNRTINFYGINYAPGSRVYPVITQPGESVYAGKYCCTLPLTDMGRANTIAIRQVANADGSNQNSGDEYCVTQVTTRGVNCDVQGYW